MIRILQGDCREVLRALDESSVDSIVTDPPYELTSARPGGRSEATRGAVMGGFMGMKWDGTGVAFDPETWRAALRVLKPGGYLLAFSGTRTYHRMVCAIEDAGFEIRDQIGWVYGSGFPKSLNVARAVDEARKPDTRLQLLPDELRFCEWMRERSGLDSDTVRRITGSARFMTGEVEIVNTATKDAPRYGRRAMVPTADAWARLCQHMNTTPPAWVESLVKEPPQPKFDTPGEEWTKGKGVGTQGSNEWAGWGTALKPAWEPIVVARKPLIGTVAENVLKHGTGALNIDGCRVATTDDLNGGAYSAERQDSASPWATSGSLHKSTGEAFSQPAGRWPANLIHDGSDEVVALFPRDAGASAPVRGTEASRASVGRVTGERERVPGAFHGDAGSAARFFYCAKADKADRNDGGANNTHPTVKPTDLMRYLCRLVTPPGGVVLDPFMGSGSTLKAAELEGFSAIGIELSPDYIEIARRRIAADAPLFAEVES